MSYTKGEWVVHPDLPRVVSLRRGDGTFSTIADVKFITYGGKDEAEANAHLIAAAPKLHLFLAWALSVIDAIKEQWTEETDTSGQPTRTAEEFMQRLSEAQEALVSAEGREE